LNLSIVKLGIRGLAIHWRLTLMMVLVVAVSLTSFLLLKSYNAGLTVNFPREAQPYLVAMQEGSLGELYGSRLPPSIKQQLDNAGASLVVPEIHTVSGTSIENAVFLRGVPLDNYSQVEDFRMVKGRSLQVGDASRLAMVGVTLAEDRKLRTGETISLRGRNFKIIGIFMVGTYEDNEVWISLSDAQNLLGWNQDVSFYIIPDDGTFTEGEQISKGVLISRRGETGKYIVNEWQPLFDSLSWVIMSLEIAAAVALANVLWRLAWLQRRELAILRSIGFKRRSLAIYLAVQGLVVATAGFFIGLLGALLISAGMSVKTAGFTLSPHYDYRVIMSCIAAAFVIALIGSLLPSIWFSRFTLAGLLRAE
jgi:putative ABC transport system permease protein